MEDQLTFARDNLDRIQAIEHSFGPLGTPLARPGRVLMGEGRLMKQSRRGPQPKVFFLFDDVLVYGSIVLRGCWYKNQQIVPLEDVQLEDLEDGLTMKNQWLIRTPRKSFYVAAASLEEKQQWMEHVEACRRRRLQSEGRSPGSTFAVSWIPDRAAAYCMRCSVRFNVRQRRHHCRKCGFVVCSACSKSRALVPHIHPTKPLRVCGACVLDQQDGDSTELLSWSWPEQGGSSEEEEVEEHLEVHDPSRWLNSQKDPWSTYVYLKPEHVKP